MANKKSSSTPSKKAEIKSENKSKKDKENLVKNAPKKKPLPKKSRPKLSMKDGVVVEVKANSETPDSEKAKASKRKTIAKPSPKKTKNVKSKTNNNEKKQHSLDLNNENQKEIDATDTNSKTEAEQVNYVTEKNITKATDYAALGTLKKRRFDDNLIKNIYITLLVGWSVAIVIFKGLFNIDVWYVAIPSMCLIIGYGAYARFAYRESPIRADRLGDNCYYLGLSYTLASLIATLLQMEKGVDGAELIGNFGVALTSTAVGVMARMVLMQYRVEVDDFEQKAKVELAETARSLTRAMNGATADFRSFDIAVRESINASVTDISESFIQTNKVLAASVSTTLKAIEARTLKADELLERFEDRFEVLDKVTGALADSADNLSKRMDDIEVHPEKLSAALERLAEGVEKTSDKLEEATDHLETSVGITADAEKILSNSEDHLRSIANLNQQMIANFELQEEASKGNLAATQDHAKAIQNLVEDIESERKDLRTASNEVFKTLGDLAKVVVKGVERV